MFSNGREHFFERTGSGLKAFSCHKYYNNDTTNALKLLGRWILDVANSNNDNDRIKDSLLIEISTILVKTILRIGKVNIRKLKDEYSISNLLNENPKKVGEVFGLCIWKLRSEVREKKQNLEIPHSLEEYQYNEIRSFENKIYFLLQTLETDFDLQSVYKELIKEVDLECRVLSPNVVILKPSENSCNNEAVHNACFKINNKRKYRSLTSSEQIIFIRLQQNSKLSIKETKEVFLEICSLSDSKPEECDLKRIRDIWLRYKRQIKRQK
ncbi:1803_t:CDS:2 [Funneliformis mosseae]|uniref:1803_t:CDS:1 n=1 Tax=Funneliformis mosseae TaxID=27381 RepID=A0A9N9ECN7_FUNMO|nr:1803_t:CDS:2 [Funneliformis mosseae]